MKKTYMSPFVQVTKLATENMFCGSVQGVDGTATLDTNIMDEYIDNYLNKSDIVLW